MMEHWAINLTEPKLKIDIGEPWLIKVWDLAILLNLISIFLSFLRCLHYEANTLLTYDFLIRE
jgi:hypothetical protein